MPTYVYKAVNKKGMIVRNRVEEGSRLVLMRKLKANGLSPISINQTIARKIQPTTKRKRNINNIQEVIKDTEFILHVTPSKFNSPPSIPKAPYRPAVIFPPVIFITPPLS